MARPLKNNADWFSHDADMRNDPRIKALRRKFGMDGYGTYNMLIEYLTDAQFFRFKHDSLTIELISGDFDVEPSKLVEILKYCYTLDLLQMESETDFVRCKTLDNRLEGLLSKRITDRGLVIEVDNTQSKVKYSKEEKELRASAPKASLSLRINAAKLLGKKYEAGADRGINGYGQDIDLIFRQAGSDDQYTFDQISAMVQLKQQEGTSLPTKPETILDNLKQTDWISLLAKKSNGAVQDLEKIKARNPQTDHVGTNKPGALG